MAFRAARLRGWTLAAALATAAVVAAVVVRFWLTPPLPAYCYLAAVAVPLAFIDARQPGSSKPATGESARTAP